MNRNQFLKRLAAGIALATLAPEIVGTQAAPAPISAANMRELENWVRDELSRRLAIVIDRQMYFGDTLDEAMDYLHQHHDPIEVPKTWK